MKIVLFTALLLPFFASGDALMVDIGPDETIVVQKHDVKLIVDGRLDEPIWQSLPAYDEFQVIEPDTLDKPVHATRVRMFYNDKGLYLGIDMDHPDDKLISRLSSRDVRALNRDSINLTLDTSGTGRYGYWFGINLGDSLMDGTLLPERQFTSDWDGAWYGKSQLTEHGWSAEFLIPWGTVSMPQTGEKRRIGFYMSRKVAYLDERWGWPALPPTVPRFISELQSLEVSNVAPKQQFSFYPFAAVAQDRVDGETNYRIGTDIFWRPSTDFQMTATLNPDFGIVESDEVVLNLTATETFFPEKRLFFLEGQEVFIATPRADTRGVGVGNAGSPTTLVFTRRIGGRPVEPTVPAGFELRDKDVVQPTELIGAAKLTGQKGKFRYGFLGAAEDEVHLRASDGTNTIRFDQDGSNYGAARLLYEDSPGGAYRAFGLLTTAVTHPSRDAYTHGIDGHYLTLDGRWKIDGQIYMSDIEGIDSGIGGFVDFRHTIRQGIKAGLGIEYQDEHVDINDLGFLERNDRLRIRSSHTRTNSDIDWARDNEFDIRGFIQESTTEDLFTGGGVFMSNRTTFHNLSRLTARLNFLPEQYDDLNSFGNGTYRIEQRLQASVNWDSDSSRELSYGVGVRHFEEELGGDSYDYTLKTNWRPSDRLAVEVSARYFDREGWLLHQEASNFTTFEAEQWIPKVSVDYFISARQQFRMALQWIGIKAREDEFYSVPTEPGDLIPTNKPPGFSDNFSVSQYSFQFRYRWEIAPLSDIFVVYTRNADRGAALRDSDFDEVFSNSWDEPLNDFLVFKIRYRFGS